jgi:hypothetical protein
MNGQPSVLIVDRSEETQEVLQTALERHGVRTLAARHPASGLQMARQYQPDLIVLDLEMDGAADCLPKAGDSFLASDDPTRPSDAPDGKAYQPRLVLLGKIRGWQDAIPNGEFVAKPYHYAPLIRKIEELLGK